MIIDGTENSKVSDGEQCFIPVLCDWVRGLLFLSGGLIRDLMELPSVSERYDVLSVVFSSRKTVDLDRL